MAREIGLDEAVAQIRLTWEDHNRESKKSPFFFIAGAGISHPLVPLAEEIIRHCQGRRQDLREPPNPFPQQRYSFWLERAYPSRDDRRAYFERLVRDKPISEANLRLAHLLVGGLAQLVVTPNFDDFLSRALHLFGVPHLVCDHPHTAARVELGADEIQVLHVHGTYKFYDLANLEGEIGERAAPGPGLTMSGLLDGLLRERSPLVVGYSGWEDDVIMTALKRRLASELPFNLYWFCYCREDLDKLPLWLKNHSDVRLVLPKAVAVAPARLAAVSPAMDADAFGEPAAGPRLPATTVFEKLIDAFKFETPHLLRDPMEFLAKHLERSFPLSASPDAPDRYSLRSVVERVRRARKLLKRALKHFERQMEALRDAVRRADYLKAVRAASALNADHFRGHRKQALEYLSALEAAIRALEKSPDVRLRACNKLIEVTGSLVKRRSGDRTLKGALASALVYKGFTLGRLGRSEEEIQVYDEVVRRFGGASEPVLRQHVAQALVNKGVALAGQLHRYQEAMTVFEDVVKRFGEAPEPVLRWLVVIALYLKGAVLVRLARFEEATAVYDEVLRRFGDASEAGAREIAAIAMGDAAESRIRSAKRTWRQGGEPQARQYLVDAKVRLNHVLAGGRHEAKMLAAAGYTAFLLDETAEAEAHISEALRLDAEEARAYLLELTGFEALPKDEQFKDWLETLGG